MKKLWIFAVLLLLGCADEEIGCYDCTTTTTVSVNVYVPGYPMTTRSEGVVCDIEVDRYEKENTYTTTVRIEDIIATEKVVTKCYGLNR